MLQLLLLPKLSKHSVWITDIHRSGSVDNRYQWPWIIPIYCQSMTVPKCTKCDFESISTIWPDIEHETLARLNNVPSMQIILNVAIISSSNDFVTLVGLFPEKRAGHYGIGTYMYVWFELFSNGQLAL